MVQKFSSHAIVAGMALALCGCAGAEPTLGIEQHRTKGLGEVRPFMIDFGGNSTGLVRSIRWESWGEEQAIGMGQALFVPPNVPTAEGTRESATIVAFNLGTCSDGSPAYTAITWYFPQHGEQFDPESYSDACAFR